MDDKRRLEYDEYLASLGYNMKKDQENLDPEEIERRRRERGKKRYMEDFDFANEEFFNMWKQRTGNESQETILNDDINFNGADI